MRKLFYMVFIPFMYLPIVVVHCIWSIGAAFLYQCCGVFDVKYNNFNFLIVTQDPITKVFTEKTDWLSLSLFLTVVFAVLWGVFFIYACLEYTLSSMVT